jgi:hypothetical protein
MSLVMINYSVPIETAPNLSSFLTKIPIFGAKKKAREGWLVPDAPTNVIHPHEIRRTLMIEAKGRQSLKP